MAAFGAPAAVICRWCVRCEGVGGGGGGGNVRPLHASKSGRWTRNQDVHQNPLCVFFLKTQIDSLVWSKRNFVRSYTKICQTSSD